MTIYTSYRKLRPFNRHKWDGITSEVNSVSNTETSNNVVDNQDRALRRAIDAKVQKLRSTLTADADITLELDRVVCRLMKLALRTSRGKQAPPPSRWMQCKLYDLLTLTERAIERRRLHFIQNFHVGSLDDSEVTTKCCALHNSDRDAFVNKILAEYDNIFNKPSEDEADLEMENIDSYEDREVNSSKYDFDFRGHKPQSTDLPMIDTDHEKVESQVKVVLESNPLERIQAWVNEKVEPDAYRFDSNSGIISSGDTDHLSKKETRTKYKKLLKKHKGRKNICSKTTLWKSQSKVNNFKNKKKNSNTKFGSSPKETKTAKHTDILTTVPHDTEKVSQSETLTDSIIDKDTDYTDDSKAVLVKKLIELGSCENNCPVDTVTEMNEKSFSPAETTTIAEANQDLSENETLVDVDVRRSPIKHNVSTEIMHTEPLFLYDPNEPTTSKGIRHTCTDVQCGPEPVANLERTSVSPADVEDLSNMKIQESMINVMDMSKNSVEFGTCTGDIIDNIGTITPRRLSTGIKIKDSLPCVETNEHSAVILNKDGRDEETEAKSLKDLSMPLNTSSETKLLKAVSSALNVDSISEACSTVESSKSPVRRKNSTNPGNKGIEFDQRSMSPPKLLTKLSCGGVHIHSYKDRQVLQDVVYQGTWQRCKHFEKGNGKVARSIRSVVPVALAKASVKKPAHDETISKKTLERGVKLKNGQAKQVAPPTSLTRNKTPVGDANHNVNLTKTKPKECKYIPLKKTKLSNQNLKKVASKIRSMAGKRSKTALVYKGTAKPAGILKNNAESKPKMKSRIPMRKKITTFDLKKNTLPDVVNIIENTKDHKKNIKYSNLNSDDIHPVNYIVFRNEIITKSSDVEGSTPIDTHTPRNDSTKQQNVSVTNSSCSSPTESVATVKAATSIHTSSKKNINNSQHSGPKSVAGNHGAGPSVNTRFKRQHGKEINKHNASQSSTDSCKSVTRPVTPRPQYTGRKKNVVVAQISTSKSGQRTKTFNSKTMKTCLKSPVTMKSNEPPTDPSNTTAPKIIKADIETVSHPQNVKSSNGAEIVDSSSRPLDETLKPEYAEGRKPSNSDFSSHVRDILEDVCNNIHNVGSNVTVIDYTDVTKNIDNPITADNDQTASEQDLKANDNISNKQEGFLQLQGQSANNSLCRTFDTLGNESVVSLTDTIHTLTDNDLVSFKSMTSYSKISEYFLADTSLNEDDFHENSVKNIFERVNGIVDESSKPPGPLAAQAFSGFSMAVGSTTGDQANFVTMVDSETGSVAVVIKRQAESEEMFVSGRSSGTFASCVLDEDSVVPDWLFDLMSQHHTLDDDEEPTVRGVMPAESVLPPFDDSMYEMNGPAEGPRVSGRDAGAAGDGRGVHSDFSQNSDSNTSETTTSDESGVLSEAIVIDPSAFTSQVDAYRNISSTSTVPPTSSELAAQNTEAPADNHRPAPNPTHRLVLPTSSGFEADVSSLECDAVDLSDN